jgi:AcrR family transcriptional regulator
MYTAIHLHVTRRTHGGSGTTALPAVKSKPRSRDAAATRRALLAAAGRLFAEFGYEATTVSQIARTAGFSPNLVTRYFGGKEGLFLAAARTGLNINAGPSATIADFGHQLADHIVDRWEQQGPGDPLLMLLRCASAQPAALEALGEFLEREAIAPVIRALIQLGHSEPNAIDRANAMQSFILGTVVTRQMMRTGASAAASNDELRAWLADVLQRLLCDVSAANPSAGNLPIFQSGPTALLQTTLTIRDRKVRA